MKKKPVGFIAHCQCGEVIGAMDYERTDRKEAGKILGKWLDEGCALYPKFESSWNAKLNVCKCKD